MELAVHYRIYKGALPAPILSQMNPVHAFHPTFWRSDVMLFSRLRLGLQSGLNNSPPKPSVHLFFFPYVPHALRISFFIWPPEYWVRCIDRDAYYALSSHLLLLTYSVQISSSVPSSRTPSGYDPPWAWGTTFGAHINQANTNHPAVTVMDRFCPTDVGGKYFVVVIFMVLLPDSDGWLFIL